MPLRRLLAAVERHLSRPVLSRRHRRGSVPAAAQILESRTLLSAVRLRVSVSSMEEGTSAHLSISASDPVQGDQTIPINVPQNLLDEYELSVPLDSLVIPDGQSTVSRQFTIIDNDFAQPDATFEWTLGTLPPGLTLHADPSDEVTILDNDPVAIEVSDVATVEGRPARVTVTLSRPANRDIEATFRTVDGTATSAEYQAGDYRVIFPAGTTTATFDVPVWDNPASQPQRDFRLELTRLATDGVDVSATLSPVTTRSTGITELSNIAFSPDGQSVVYHRHTGLQREMVSVSATGGQTHVIGSARDFVIGPQSRHLAVSRGNGVSILTLDGEHRGDITGPVSQTRGMQFTPDGSHVVFLARNMAGNYQLWTGPSTGGDATLLGDNEAYIVYFNSPFSFTPDGQGIVVLGETTRSRLDLLYIDLFDGSLRRLNLPSHEQAAVSQFRISSSD